MNKTENHFIENLPKILEMIDNDSPKIELCKFLKIKQDTFNKYLKKHNIDYAGNQSRKGRPHHEQRTSYKEYTENGKNITNSRLRIKLVSQGIKEEKCECCGLTEWMDKPIPLELHHLDFNHYNNNIDNLVILCSNCHMQSHDYCNTNK